MNQKSISILMLILGFMASCTSPIYFNSEEESDLRPPQLLSFGNTEQGLLLEFDEDVRLPGQDIKITPDLSPLDCVSHEHFVTILTQKQNPGQDYELLISVEDANGNSQNLMIAFYGLNLQLPGVLINEFTTQGSSTHPDLVEIYLLESGNIGGLCFFEGVKDDWDQRFVFPAMDLQAGDYILLHTKPSGIPEEINEIEDCGSSQGYDANDQAYDFWLPQGEGLSSNNGVISIYSSPNGELLDAVLYSNRKSSSDEKYQGFGSRKTLEWAEELLRQGGWVPEGQIIRPEDALNPDDSTATRSMGRIPGVDDTNTKADWMIVATREASFGWENSSVVYEP